MAETTTNSTWRYVHGGGAADSSPNPSILVNFDVVCTRTEGSSEVQWKIQNMDWDYWGANYYGYYIRIYVAVNPVDPYDPDYDTELVTILEKEVLTSSYWWNYINIYNPDYPYQKFNSTSTTGTCYIYAEVNDCCRYDNNTYPCYITNSGSHFCLFDSFQVDLPIYETFYTVSYDANGGSGAPDDQTKSNISDLVLSSVIPTYPLSIRYYNNTNGSLSNTITVYRQFTGWNTKADGSGTSYAAGGTYSANEPCTLYAQWGSATHTTLSIPDRYYTVTYNYGGGTGSPASVSLQRSEDGYATTSGGAKAYNQNETYTDITDDLNLYPRYGNAVLTSLPQPTRSGYEFKGWYTDTSYSTQVTTPYTVQNNITIYAKWMALPIHQFQPNGIWNNIGPYVWRFNGTSWERVAHVYKFDGTSWKDLSV